jgi:RNA polymerase sigma-70 factor (ECF subfamily)
MSDNNFLADQFEANRAHLRAVAYRMLGSRSEAEDAVQEAWLRLGRTDADDIKNLGGWLTTVVARICLDMLRTRKSRREEQLGPHIPEPTADNENGESAVADSVGAALLIVLDTLAPAERLAFVLHDMFAVPFEEIAPIVGRAPAAARQLASRARRRVQGVSARPEADLSRQRTIVDAFLAASRNGDFEALLAVLDPEVVFRSDATATKMGGAAELRGAEAVANTFKGRAQAAKPAVVDGAMAIAVVFGGRLRIVLELRIVDDRIAGIQAVGDTDRLQGFEIAVLGT